MGERVGVRRVASLIGENARQVRCASGGAADPAREARAASPSKVVKKGEAANAAKDAGLEKRDKFATILQACLDAPSPVRHLKEKERLRELEREKLGLVSKEKRFGTRLRQSQCDREREEESRSCLSLFPSLDRLLVRGMLFHGYHGVFVEENKLGQKFLVDVDAWVDLRPAGESDDLEQSVSYTDIYKQVKAIVEGPPFKLQESVASAIAKAILSTHPSISDVRVKICKPHVAIEGVLDYLGVEIFRSSKE